MRCTFGSSCTGRAVLTYSIRTFIFNGKFVAAAHSGPSNPQRNRNDEFFFVFPEKANLAKKQSFFSQRLTVALAPTSATSKTEIISVKIAEMILSPSLWLQAFSPSLAHYSQASLQLQRLQAAAHPRSHSLGLWAIVLGQFCTSSI